MVQQQSQQQQQRQGKVINTHKRSLCEVRFPTIQAAGGGGDAGGGGGGGVNTNKRR
ncbi:GH24262 [Drosophila grimshawi]|uniref:GH24262 n=1 Tax=Drosophila grimshawi TaxID=7222 RepID=B4JMV4_DROGR|nr:GH24262 [Drosophila grimshawi]